ncbi:MAG TPA: sigma-70 family RNA polymerase sigma factor [Novosphingobium sp.]
MRPQPLIDMQANTFDGEEERLWHELIEDGSAKAREKLFALHTRFARNIGRRICRERNYGDIDPHDVDQAAFAGLIEALDRFDPSRGTPFRGFAVSRISGNVIDTISKMNEMREQISWRHRIRSQRVRSLHVGNTEALSTEQAMDALIEIAVGLAVGFMLEGTGLYQEEDAVVAPNAYESAAWNDMRSTLRACLEKLPDRERLVLSHHYFDGIAFDQIAALYRLSKGRISQLHRSALDRLRRTMREQGHFKLEQ